MKVCKGNVHCPLKHHDLGGGGEEVEKKTYLFLKNKSGKHRERIKPPPPWAGENHRTRHGGLKKGKKILR